MFCKKCGTEVPENVKFCKKCGNPMPVKITATTYTEPPRSAPKTKPASHTGAFARVLGSAVGRLLLYIAIYAASFGLIAILLDIGASGVTPIFIVVVAIIVIPGWRYITFITPAMFVWMSFAGWVAYFVIKFMLSCALGLFIVPYNITKSIINAFTGYYDDYDE